MLLIFGNVAKMLSVQSERLLLFDVPPKGSPPVTQVSHGQIHTDYKRRLNQLIQVVSA